MKYADLLLINKNELKRQFEKTEPNADWRVNIIKELLEIRDNQLECGLDKYEINMMLDYISIFR